MTLKKNVELPLAGIKVLEFGHLLAVPYCGMLLADMGADVLKVERPGTGDMARKMGSIFVGDDATTFISLNRNKRSMVLNLTKPEAQEIAKRLISEADVLLENFERGTMERFGLGYEDVKKEAPRLIYCSVSAFGEDGPYRDLPGMDPLLQAMGGAMALTGERGGTPLMAGAPIADVSGAMNAFQGVLLALIARHASGAGQQVQVALLDAVISSILPREWDYFGTGERPKRMGNAHRQMAPYQSYETSDGWIYVACVNDAYFRRLLTVVEMEELAEDERFVDNPRRVANRDELNGHLAPRFKERRTAEWLAALRAAKLMVAPIYELDETFNDPQVIHNGVVITVNHPTAGEIPTIRPAFRLRASPDIPRNPPPLLGADTEDVLRSMGYQSESVRRLKRQGVI